MSKIIDKAALDAFRIMEEAAEFGLSIDSFYDALDDEWSIALLIPGNSYCGIDKRFPVALRLAWNNFLDAMK